MTADPLSRPTSMLSRRRALMLVGAAALCAASPLRARAAVAWRRVPEIVALVGAAEPQEGGVTLDLPFVSENGSSVPLSVAAEGPGVRALHIFAPANPSPQVATFHFTPLSPVAAVETRIRLNESQTVIAVAVLEDGAVRIAEREVRVTVSGCLTSPGTYASDNLFRTRVRVPDRLAAGAIYSGAGSAAGVVESAGGRVLAGAVSGAASTVVASNEVRSRDQMTLTYRLEAAGGRAVLEKTHKRRASADSEDMLTPLVEAAAEAIAARILGD